MKQTFLTVATITTILAFPVSGQQAENFVPGENFMTSWDVNEDGKITLDELNERRAELFSAFDENEDGRLSAEEFGVYDQTRKESMQRPQDRGNGGGRGELAISLAASDSDKDGSVSLEEFLAASAVWFGVMDKNGDGVIAAADFGGGQGGQGQGQGRQAGAQNQPMGQQQGMGNGHGRGNGKGQGQGQGGGQGRMQNQQPGGQMGQGNGQGRGQGGRWQQGMAPDQQPQMGQRGGQGRGHGQQGGKGTGGSQRTVPFAAFPTNDGALWVIDTRTGGILACKVIADSNAAAGFVPVCLEARL